MTDASSYLKPVSLAAAARLAFLVAAFSGFTATALGALAAHALKARLPVAALGWIETGVRYQFFHTAALLAAALWLHLGASTLVAWSSWAFMLGIVLFSGSLYLMAFTGFRGIAVLTPLGGIALLAGWGLMFTAAWQMGVR